jgi:hypothetical protein
MRRHRQGLDSPSVVDDSLSSRDDVMSETMPPTKRARVPGVDLPPRSVGTLQRLPRQIAPGVVRERSA